MPVRGKRSIADTYVSILPETSRVAAEIAKAFREVDPEAKRAGRRWRDEINNELGDVRAKVNLDGAQARADAERLKRQIERDPVTIQANLDVDRRPLDNLLGGGGGGGGRGGSSGGGGGLSGGGGALKLNLGLVGIGLLPAAATAITNVAGAVQQLAGAGLAVPGIFAGVASSVGVATLGMSGMKDAYDAVTKASDGTQKSVDAANKALAGLAPNAAETVKTVVGLKGTFTDLRNIAGQNMFAGVSDGLKGLATQILPEVTRGVDGISRGLNQNILQTLNSLGSQSSQGFLERILGNTGDAQSRLTAAIDPVIHAVGVLTAAGSDTLPRLADAVGAVADRFNNFITAADGDGRLAKWIDQGLDGFTNLGNIVLNLGKTFTGITEAAGGGDGLLATLENASGALATFVNSDAGQQRLMQFFADGRDLLGQLKDIAVELGPVLGDVFTVAANTTGFWLPVIREALSILNSIPGGAQAVVTAFVTWKTISGVSSLVSGLGGVSRALGVLPGQAAAAAGGISAALGPVAALAASIMALTGGKPGDYLGNGSKGIKSAVENGDWSRALYGDFLGGKMNEWLGTGPQATGVLPVNPLDSGAGHTADAQRARRGGVMPALPTTDPSQPTSGLGSNFYKDWYPQSSVEIPAISSYVPPVVTETGSGGSAATASSPMMVTPENAMAAIGLAQDVNGTPYDMGGTGPTVYDCSGFMSDLYAAMTGQPYTGPRLFTTESDFSKLGFLPGYREGDFNIGVHNGGGGALSHMAGTLPNGVNVEASSGQGARYGGPAAGARDPQFEKQYHLPVSSAFGEQLMGMGGGSPALAGLPGGGPLPASLRNAQQRVDDTQWSVDQAQRRLDEVNSKAKVSASQREQAEHSLAKAKREHADAINDLATAQEKYNEKQAKGQGNSDFSKLGQDLVGGMFQAFGFDGSLFSDPSQWGIMKLLSGGANYLTKPLADQSGGAGGSSGGGSLLSGFIPQAFGALRLGSQDNAPVPFMGGAPGYAEGASMAAGAQFATSSLHGAASQMGATPGPGNQSNDMSINFYGPVGSANEGMQAATDFNIPRARQAVRQ